MDHLPRISWPSSILLNLEPLEPATFAPFGHVIASPLGPSTTTIPPSLPQAQHPQYQPAPHYANQGTALKTSPISPLLDNYPPADSSVDIQPSRGLMSIFSCFPRENVYLDRQGRRRLRIDILERHPFTTQTFCPLNFSNPQIHSSQSALWRRQEERKTFFLVVVAPTTKDTKATPPNPPDLSRMRAFVAPVTVDGSQSMAVTYNAGTWHAPMVVLGARRVDFLVSQFANGTPDHDCQEVLVGADSTESSERAHVVEVSLEGLEIQFMGEKSSAHAKL